VRLAHDPSAIGPTLAPDPMRPILAADPPDNGHRLGVPIRPPLPTIRGHRPTIRAT